MYRLKIDQCGPGMHPSEVVVAVKTTTGREELIVDKRSIEDGSIKIGFPLRVERDRYLVELPRETIRGSWRVWVPRGALVEVAAA